MGPVRTFAYAVSARAKPRAGAHRRFAAARAWPCGPRPLRCSHFGRAAELAAFAALSSLGQPRRVSSRSALRAPTEVLRSSAPQRRAAGHPPTALREPHVLSEEGRREAGIKPASRRAPRARVLASRRLDACGSASFTRRGRWLAKTWAGGGRSDSAAPSSAAAHGRACSALRRLTRRMCSSVESAANAASYAAGHETRAAQGTWPAGPRTSRSEAAHAARTRLCSRERPQRVACRPSQSISVSCVVGGAKRGGQLRCQTNGVLYP